MNEENPSKNSNKNNNNIMMAPPDDDDVANKEKPITASTTGGVSFGLAVEEVSPSGAVTSSAVHFDEQQEEDHHGSARPARRQHPSNHHHRMSLMERISVIRHEHYFYRRSVKEACFPHGFFTKNFVPVLVTLLAWVLTVYSSWSCHFFKGAQIGFTNPNYGLWTLENINGKCQLWEVLFYSYLLDRTLVAARVFSMISMVLGLSLLVSIVQANQYHILSWGLGFILMLIFVISASTTSQFNLWSIFYAFTYIIFTLIVRFLLIHPIHRRISERGTKILCSFFVLIGFFCSLTFLALKSDYCTCGGLSPGELDGRVVTDCEGTCVLDVGGYMMILACILWFAAAVAIKRIGAQPEELHKDPTKRESMYGKYANTKSITSQAVDIAAAMKITMTKKERKEIEKSLSDIPEDGDIVDEGAEENNGSSNDEDTDGLAASQKTNAEQEQDFSDRTCCQKLCCDYRVKPRNRQGKIFYWTFRSALAFIFTFYVFILVIFIGSKREMIAAESAPDTSPNFILDPVCAFNASEPEAEFITFPDADSALATGLDIAHCGPCAKCSNMHDIETYILTRKTIANSAKECSMVSIFGSYDDLVDCLGERIDFTRQCQECWATNMVSTAKYCRFTCLTTLFNGFMTTNNVDGTSLDSIMNHCIECDEKMSGNGFVTCSGVARRRLNVVSEIMRNPELQCKTVTIDWVNYFPGEEEDR